jgi:hypothetical protein
MRNQNEKEKRQFVRFPLPTDSGWLTEYSILMILVEKGSERS